MSKPSPGYVMNRALKSHACMVVIADDTLSWVWPDITPANFLVKHAACQTLIEAEETEGAETSGQRGVRDEKLDLLRTKMQQFVALGKQHFRSQPAKLRLLKPLQAHSRSVKGTLEQALKADAAWTEVDSTYVPEAGNTCAAFHTLRLLCVTEAGSVATESAEESEAGGDLRVALDELYRLSVDWYQEATRRFGPETAHGMMIREEIPTQATGVQGEPVMTATGGAGAIDVNATCPRAETLKWFYRLVGALTFLEASSAVGEDTTFDGLTPGSYEVKVRGENAEGHGPESEMVTVVVT